MNSCIEYHSAVSFAEISSALFKSILQISVLQNKYKGKRWGSVNKSEDGDWHIRICVQYDEFLEPVLSNESAAMQELVRMRTGHGGCGRCVDGKCAFTGFDLVNPAEEQIELAKRLIKFRINAIKDGIIISIILLAVLFDSYSIHLF